MSRLTSAVDRLGRYLLFMLSVILLAGFLNALRAESFEQAFRAQEYAGAPEASELQIRGEALRAYRIVFVAGVLNEVAPGYFRDSRKVLRKQYGVADSTVIFPKSFYSISHNAEILYKEFLKIHFMSGKPLIVLAHSKGAAETLLALLQHPDLLRQGVVEKVYALQGAVNGSYIADKINGGGSLNVWARFVARRMPGVMNLGTAQAREVMNAARAAASAETQQLIRDRVFYIRSTEDPWSTVFYMIGTSLYLRHGYGPSDGVLLVDDQLLPGLGTDLGVVRGIDHSDFVMAFPYSGSFRGTRKAFTHAWVRFVLGLAAPDEQPVAGPSILPPILPSGEPAAVAAGQ